MSRHFLIFCTFEYKKYVIDYFDLISNSCSSLRLLSHLPDKLAMHCASMEVYLIFRFQKHIHLFSHAIKIWKGNQFEFSKSWLNFAISLQWLSRPFFLNAFLYILNCFVHSIYIHERVSNIMRKWKTPPHIIAIPYSFITKAALIHINFRRGHECSHRLTYETRCCQPKYEITWNEAKKSRNFSLRYI